MGDATGKFDYLDPAPHIATRFVDRLAVFSCHEPGECLEVLLQQVAVTKENAGAFWRGHASPSRKGPLCRLHGGLHINLVAQRDAGDDFTRGGIEDVAELSGCGLGRTAGDEMAQVHGMIHGACGSNGEV